MKRITSLILALCLVLALCSCKEIEKSQEVVNNFFTALQNSDQDTIKTYIVNNSEETSSEEETINDNGEAYTDWSFADHFTKAFTKITYNIISAEQDAEDKNRVNVTVDVTSVDMGTLFGEAMSEAINASFANIFSSGEDNIDVSAIANDYFAKSLEKEDLPYTTKTVSIPVVKTKDGMKIETNEDLGDAVTGGLFSYIAGFSQNAN